MSIAVVLLLLIGALLSSGQLYWEKLDTVSPTKPDTRRDCAIGYDAVNNRIFIFGGRGTNGILDDTWSFDLSSKVWNRVSTTGTPGKRFSVVSGVWDNGFYVSTGEGVGRIFFDDIWKLDLTTFVWKQLPSGSIKPEKRYGSAGGIFQQGNSDFLYLTHGFSGQRYSNTFRYDLLKEKGWEEMFSGTNPYDPRYPHARCLHSATMISPHQFIMYGGCLGGGGTGGPCPADDAWKYDGEKNEWDRVPHCASPRVYSSMALLPIDKDAENKSIIRVVLYGGGETGKSVIHVEKAEANEVVIFNGEKDDWTKREINGTVPLKRSGAAMVTVNNGIIMYGGSSSNGHVWLLEGTSKMADKTKSGAECNLFLFTYIQLHGIFMFIGWGILLQLGMFFGRYFRHRDPLWFKLHRGFQIFGLIVAICGFAFAILSVPFDHLKFAHGGIGLFIMILGICQPLNAFFRPHKTEQPTMKRKIWEIFHINIGRVALILALINITLGVFLAVVPYTAWVIWLIILAVWIAVLIMMEVRLQFSRYKASQETVSHLEMTNQ